MAPTYNLIYNNYISLTGDKLQACLKVTECPPNTMLKMAQDSSVNQMVLDALKSCDVVIACPDAKDRKDFADTRLATTLSLLKRKKILTLETRSEYDYCTEIQLPQILDHEIDEKIQLEQSRVKDVCHAISH
jgi:hypothetical protein